MARKRKLYPVGSLGHLMAQIEHDEIERRLRRFDYDLMEFVETHQEAIGLRASGELVSIQRRLRRLRYQIEGNG